MSSPAVASERAARERARIRWREPPRREQLASCDSSIPLRRLAGGAPASGRVRRVHRFTRTREGLERGQRTAGHPRGRRDRTAVRVYDGPAAGPAAAPARHERVPRARSASCWRPRARPTSPRGSHEHAQLQASRMLARAGLDHLLRGCSRESYWLGRTVV